VRTLTDSVGILEGTTFRGTFQLHEETRGIGIHPAHEAHPQVEFGSVLGQGALRGPHMAGIS